MNNCVGWLQRGLKVCLLGLLLSTIPNVYAWIDSDQDGVPDLKDACPNTPARSISKVLANGCLNTPVVESATMEDYDMDMTQTTEIMTDTTMSQVASKEPIMPTADHIQANALTAQSLGAGNGSAMNKAVNVDEAPAAANVNMDEALTVGAAPINANANMDEAFTVGAAPINANMDETLMVGAAAMDANAKMDETLTVGAAPINANMDEALTVGAAPAKPAVAPPVKPVKKAADHRRKILSAVVYFESGAQEVDLSQWKALAAVKAFLDRNAVSLTLEGHTDTVGTAELNNKLSLQRAESVKRIMVEDYGFDPARFKVLGKGAEAPLSSNASDEARSLNRRVQFIVNNP